MARPFVHDDLDAKGALLRIAREFKDEMADSLEKELAAGMIYMNLADYLAEYLVVGFSSMVEEASSQYFLGVVGYNSPQTEKLNIGQSMKHLERFEFANKGKILKELKAINVARNLFAHQLFKIKPTEAVEIDQAVKDIIDHTEKLVALVDLISAGLPPRTMNDKIVSDPATVQRDAQELVTEQSADEPTDSKAVVAKPVKS